MKQKPNTLFKLVLAPGSNFFIIMVTKTCPVLGVFCIPNVQTEFAEFYDNNRILKNIKTLQ